MFWRAHTLCAGITEVHVPKKTSNSNKPFLPLKHSRLFFPYYILSDLAHTLYIIELYYKGVVADLIKSLN